MIHIYIYMYLYMYMYIFIYIHVRHEGMYACKGAFTGMCMYFFWTWCTCSLIQPGVGRCAASGGQKWCSGQDPIRSAQVFGFKLGPSLAASSAIQQEGLDEKCPKSHGLLVFFFTYRLFLFNCGSCFLECGHCGLIQKDTWVLDGHTESDEIGLCRTAS